MDGRQIGLALEQSIYAGSIQVLFVFDPRISADKSDANESGETQNQVKWVLDPYSDGGETT